MSNNLKIKELMSKGIDIEDIVQYWTLIGKNGIENAQQLFTRFIKYQKRRKTCKGETPPSEMKSVLITNDDEQPSTDLGGQSEQFKATKVWNEIIACFKEAMTLRTNQKQNQALEKCFSGKDAVQWLHSYLQVRQSPTVIRKEQAVLFLTKLVESNVLVCVRVNSKKKVNDSKNIYRFQELFDQTSNKTSACIKSTERFQLSKPVSLARKQYNGFIRICNCARPPKE